MMISSSKAAAAYSRTQSALSTSGADASVSGSTETTGFGDALQSAIDGVVNTGEQAEAKAAAGLHGQGNLTDIVTSVSQAQIVMQTASTVRDRVIQSYQDIMRMTI
ncbi:flagellar hook-basal body complex protein FliE [Acetobacter estunensis]|uniref:flagellar hook-basal body complex protein FliE n=1 Tax=Acetobacter estunensis TaxID=104097 RepID=UPI001C2CE41F|nr:flagellar hook-basal body complex protein FliE [Acetobacter estunensis]MBV1837471.1 flagellar hook-basal body complex protein FliE [Acetobacter estunensis]